MQSRYFNRRQVSASRSGFTLIELLVVIAIIAILAAILFPVFAQAREKARSASCLSNVKQLGLAEMQYNQDYDETYTNGTYRYGSTGGWAAQVYPYVKSAQMYRCPSDSTDVQKTDKASSYGMNSNICKLGNNNATPVPIPNEAYALADMNAPAKTVLLYEVEGNTNIDLTQYYEGPYLTNYNSSPFGNGSSTGYSPSGGGTFAACPPKTNLNETLKYATGYFGERKPALVTLNLTCFFTGENGRHTLGSNYLMADGHAKWLRGTQVSAGRNATIETGAENPNQYGNAAGTSGAFKSGGSVAATFSIK